MTSMPRRPKCSAIFWKGGLRLLGRPATTLSSVWSTTSMCLADEGTKLTTSLSKVTRPTRSRW